MQLFFSPRPALRERLPVTRLHVFVLFTGEKATIAALRAAAGFVSGLGGEIVIAATQIVPYPLPLNRPPVDSCVLLGQVANSLSQAGIGSEPSPKVLLAYARDPADGWRSILPPHCIVILGRAKRSPLQRFRSWSTGKFLRNRGYEVLVA